MAVSASKERTMKHFGRLAAFDQETSTGSIRPEAQTDNVSFEKGAFSWGKADAPRLNSRLSYEMGKNQVGTPVAINLVTV
jgi:hypothetical protein